MAKIYLDSFRLPSTVWEEAYLNDDIKMKMTCYSHPYPLKLFPDKDLSRLTFAPITIFYGGNGSGKNHRHYRNRGKHFGSFSHRNGNSG